MTAGLLHPARCMPYGELEAGLDRAAAAGLAYRRPGNDGLVLYCYSSRCVYETAWDEFTLLARGLILDTVRQVVVATPFPKFFNVGERGIAFPDGPFEIFEKLDGSLIIIFHHDGGWRTATKGAFDSDQAQWAQERLKQQDLTSLVPGTTYLAEAVYPENRIVIRYADAALVLLAAYDPQGGEVSFDEVRATASRLRWRAAERYAFKSVGDLLSHAKALPATSEGYVVRFADGLRLKLKGEEYRRIHALITRCTPLAMWEAIVAGDDMEAIRRDLPEEFWQDFDDITRLLAEALTRMTDRIAAAAASVAHLSDKELGLSRSDLPDDVQPYVFPWRKAGGILNAKMRQALLRDIRPTGNVLPGYTPSYAIFRVMEEAS